jgi:glyoxylate reductase
MSRIAVLADLPLAEYFAPLLEKSIELFDLGEFQNSTTLQHHLGPKIEGLITYGHPHIDNTILSLLPNLKVVSNHGVGVDHINLDDARARGIPVGHTPGAVDGATADLAITLMLVAARQIIASNQFADSNNYRQPHFSDQQMLALRGCDVFGATLGIIGLGRIGKQIAKRAAGFDMNMLYYKRSRDLSAEATLNIEYMEMAELLHRSDFVIISVPLNASTYRMIGATELEQMKSTAILINVARGGVVDTDALVAALTHKTIRGAALDVTDPEPLPAGHPLHSLSNVTITPHIGSFTEQTRRGMAELTVRNLLAGLQGKRLEFDATR